MSKIALSPNASGTGVFTIASPNGNTDRTLTLPDEAGTVLTTAGVPASAMPAGSVIQVVQYYNPSNNANTTTSTSAVASGVKKTITPIFSNSLIIIQTHISMAYSNGWGRATLYLNGSPMTGAGSYTVGYTDVGHNAYSPYVCNAQYQATSTSPLEFEIYVAAGSGSYTYTHGNSSSSMTLWEIAQ